jgi:hypothetical protein
MLEKRLGGVAEQGYAYYMENPGLRFTPALRPVAA